jgi:hypothetical protein
MSYLGLLVSLFVSLCLVSLTHAMHFPDRAERAIESWGSFGPEFEMEYPGRNNDRDCAGEPEDTVFWFNHSTHKYMACEAGVATEQAYVMTVDKDLLTVSRDAWFKDHIALGNIAEIDKSPVSDELTHILLNMAERITDAEILQNIDIRGISGYITLDLQQSAAYIFRNEWLNTEIEASSPADYQEIQGSTSYFSHNGSGTVETVFNFVGLKFNSGTGIIENSIGLFTGPGRNLSTGEITFGVGVAIESPVNSGGGDFNEVVGLLVQDQSVTNPPLGSYNILSQGVNSKNKLEGVLDVDGAATFNDVTGSATGLTIKNHVITRGSAPALSGNCGMGATLAGNDTAGRITIGDPTMTCTITFASPWSSTPACVISRETSTTLRPIAAATTTTLTINSTPNFMAGDRIVYHCLGI